MILQADSRHIPLKDGSANCIITSPPYWSLRKYDIPDLIWDGDSLVCPIGNRHEWVEVKERVDETGFERNRKGLNKAAEMCDGNPRVATTDIPVIRKESQFCLYCSAWRGQLGLEPTIDLYLKHLLQIMDECKRVLRDDGTMWVNLSDSYSGSGKGIGTDRNKCKEVYTDDDIQKTDWSNIGIPPKSLCLIPERFAIEMVNRGWILRNKLIWHKPNCMPSSVKDRFTVDFEDVFFFVKSRKYWFEQQFEEMTFNRWSMSNKAGSSGKPVKHEQGAPGQSPHSFQREGHSGYFRKDGTPLFNPQGRNMRTVWMIPTAAYSEAHFATFPEALVEPMIRAGCPVGGIVLDPFCGSGTVIKVAEKLQRKGIGIDLGYQELAEKRRRFNQIELLA